MQHTAIQTAAPAAATHRSAVRSSERERKGEVIAGAAAADGSGRRGCGICRREGNRAEGCGVCRREGKRAGGLWRSDAQGKTVANAAPFRYAST